MSEESGSGLQFLSAGSVESLYVGSTYELKVGSVNEILVGTETKINAAVSSAVSLEAEMAYKAGCGVEWSNVGGYKIEQGEVFELKEESSQFATRELKFQAARTPPAQGVGVPLDAIKNAVKNMLLAVAAVNLVVGGVEAAGLASNTLGETENRKNEEGVEQDGWLAGSVGVIGAAFTALSLGSCYALLQEVIESLMKVYEALPAVSTVTLSETGIKQQANFTATGSLIDLSATGVAIKSGAGTVAMTGVGDLSSLSLPADGNPVLNGDLSVTVKSPVDVKVGQVAGALTSGLSATPAEVTLKNTDASSVVLTPASAKIAAVEVSMLSGINGFSANAARAKMSCGANSVTADDLDLTLSAGACQMRFTPASVVLNGPLVQLG